MTRVPAIAALAAATLFAVPTATATAVPQQPPGSAEVQLNISMQAQQKNNWCWAGSGNTIAAYFGRDYTQNQFCNAAFQRRQGTACPNWQANLGNVQNAFDWMGINPGSYVGYPLDHSTIRDEINHSRPIETRIGWRSGGGHMHVIYGYDSTRRTWVYWGDPWPSNYRYNWANYDWYVNNQDFSWTHSLYGIGS
ncbi:papain-like cysteine protease family protein [Streptomyces orinoci]|uniref:Papain-like cysteine protease family protein n=1 Tax=Streptomyces orinoci TaxID=67339 RepID=A0ABV3K0M9_STRON|nr:papain-like cysteine protease family protein [Streptomyces orinoci]